MCISFVLSGTALSAPTVPCLPQCIKKGRLPVDITRRLAPLADGGLRLNAP